MTLGVSYMGTKRQLAEHVARIVGEAPEGPLLDAFAGMCAVGSAVGTARPIWLNDMQHFAATVSAAFFCSEDLPPAEITAVDAIYPIYAKHISDTEQVKYNHCSGQNDSYNIFSTEFADVYFSARQAAEIDGLRKSIDLKCERGTDEHRWLLLALCRAISRCSTTTGHFAQPLTRKPSNERRFANQRVRSIFSEWRSALAAIAPCGSKSWRQKNRAFQGDALGLLDNLNATRSRPAVIYADPPYTKDQYSRYYHVYETLILYDHPECVGTARYRPDRFSSPFSLKTGVAEAIELLVAKAARLDSELILSYPEGGLLERSTEQIPDLIAKHYGRSPKIEKHAHLHSTMGGSKGRSKEEVSNGVQSGPLIGAQ